MSQRSERLTRRDRLDRLRIQTPCSASWDQMQGDDRERFCGRCDKSVLDFSRLTPSEIDARLQASRVFLCGRLTRSPDGALLTLHSRIPDSVEPCGRRASPAAAVLVTALLSVGALKGQTARSDVEATTDGLAERSPERSTEDPADSLAASADDEKLAAESMMPEAESVTMGEIVAVAEPLRRVFVDASVVVFATAGETRVLSGQQDWGEVETELHVEEILKGRVRRARVLFRHYENLPQEGVEAEFRPAPGSEVLAFLNPRDAEGAERRGRTFESADPMFGVRVMTPAERVVYRARIEDLARITAVGVPQPEEVAEWLVASAEELETRGEVTGELGSALAELDASAQRLGRGAEERSADLRSSLERFRAEGGWLERELSGAMVAATLTDRQKARLTDALVSTRRLDDADLSLADLVRRWAPQAVSGWLDREARVLLARVDLAEDPASNVWLLQRVATAFDRPALRALADAAEQEVAAIYSRLAEEFAELDSAELPESYESRARPELEELSERVLHEFAAQLDRAE